MKSFYGKIEKIIKNEPKIKNPLIVAIRDYYCPLVKAWQKQGCTDEEIKVLCDHAMCGDRGIAESFGCELDLPATIANGDDMCQIRFVRRKK